MKKLKWIGIVVLFLPFILIAAFIVFEMFGICVNHAATDRQTEKLQADLAEKISDVEFISVHSETGNTGNGNHVDCVSEISFSTAMTESEIIGAMSESYDFDKDGCSVNKTDDGSYTFYQVTSAPFPDNIGGH
ncbi:MAG: hypothetical protein K2N37_06510 [Lachnospiraceae bacterium]|nr:hypothetical protein [Lachnospiraceae bacterium]